MESARLTADWRKLWHLFHAALERTPEERRAFLERASGSDTALRKKVEGLLEVHDRQAAVLDRPPSLALRTADEGSAPPEETAGPSLVPGRLLAGRFEIVRPLGRGGMSTVYQARDRELGLDVAVKVLRPEIARDEAGRRRFQREARLSRRVTDPNACRVFDFYQDTAVAPGEQPLAFLTMELLPGRTLADCLAQSGPLPLSRALEIVQQVGRALIAAHRVGVVHRDLKTRNVMMVPEADGRTRAVVTDFGLATATAPIDHHGSRLTGTGQLLGTPAHMAPEQLLGGEITPATDVYALGLLLHELITGRLPFTEDTPLAGALKRLEEPAPSPRRHLPQLDRTWERTIRRCLERRPEDRFPSVAAVVAALEGRTAPGGLLSRRRYRRRLGAVAVVALLLIALSLSLRQRSPAPGPESAARTAQTGLDGLEPIAARPHRVLICSFENLTGETLFDGTVEYALERHLDATNFARVVPRGRVADTLRLMRRPPESPVDAALGREIALRHGQVDTLIQGRVERTGSAYAVGIDLLDPATGRIQRQLREEAVDPEGVVASLGPLAEAVRLALGEESDPAGEDGKALAAVATPSLRALRLYSRAEVLFEGHLESVREAAELLRQATAEDPEFASAHILLAWTLHTLRRPATEYLPPAEAALALSDDAAEHERHFIRGSYHHLRGERAAAIAEYRQLVRLRPDHFWGANALAIALNRSGRRAEARAYLMRSAELRPDHFATNAQAAWRLSQWGARPEETRPYVSRALALATENDTPWLRAWMRALALHEHWAGGDLARYVGELDAWVEELDARSSGGWEDGLRTAAGLYRHIGRLRKAEELHRRAGEGPAVEIESWSLELDRLDEEDWRAHLRNHPWADTAKLPLQRRDLITYLLARAGLVAEARALLPHLSQGPWPLLVEGELALAEGRTDAAIRSLEAGLETARQIGSLGRSFLAADGLARAWERKGDLEQARRVLLDASPDRALVPSAKSLWMQVRLHLAQLDRELGRVEEARAIEAELHRLLAYADPDYRLARELGRLEARDAYSGG